jgi:FAD/FMN-containing dehydrogenase
VKSGGHAAFRGASSIEGGITVDLAGLNNLKLSSDQKTVTVGPGNRWYDVYSYLEPYSLTVIGGRAATVGVGGLTVSCCKLLLQS